MSNVVQLHAKKPRQGQKTFLLCHCTKEGTPFIAMVINGDRPYIAAMVCPKCDSEVAVVNGALKGLPN